MLWPILTTLSSLLIIFNIRSICSSLSPSLMELQQKMEPQQKSTIMDLPDDVLTDIFLRLKAKSIRCCKCVCKPWRTLLTGNRFIKLHFHRSTLRNPNPNFFVIAYDYPSCQTLDSEFDDGPVNLHLDFQEIMILGSCNGLICLYDRVIHVLNPSTRENIDIPFPSVDFCKSHRHLIGFGYDAFLKKYKLVIIMLDEKDKAKEVLVYTLGTNSWITRGSKDAIEIQSGVTDVPYFQKVDAQVNNILHWSYRVDSIISFDFTSEKFGELSWPAFQTRYVWKELRVWEGCLAAYGIIFGEGFDIWTMKDYGVQESWTKIISIRQPSVGRHFCILFPVVLMKNGDILLNLDMRGLLLYDHVNKTVRIPIHVDFRGDFLVVPYVEVLTSIASIVAGFDLEEIH